MTTTPAAYFVEHFGKHGLSKKVHLTTDRTFLMLSLIKHHALFIILAWCDANTFDDYGIDDFGDEFGGGFDFDW